jgi:stage III sporulation protein SpoIIIAA
VTPIITTPPLVLPTAPQLATPQIIVHPIDEERLLASMFPAWIQRAFHKHKEGIEELAIDYGKPLIIRQNSEIKVIYNNDAPISKDDLEFINNKVPGGFRADNRAGIEGTVHRISAVRDRYQTLVGVTIRIGRFIEGVAEGLRDKMLANPSLLVVGAPGSGKSTFLRDAIRIIGQVYFNQLVLVDTSNELGGDGMIAHPRLGLVRRIQVPSPEKQPKTLLEAVGNHSPKAVAVDEIGVHGDIPIIASAHGSNLKDVMQNPVLYPVLGDYNPISQKRSQNTTFKTALEIHSKGVYKYYPDLEAVVDCFARGEDYRELGELIDTTMRLN